MKPGDEIVAIGQVPIGSDLNAFASAFASAKKSAHDKEQASFPMTLRSSGATRTVAVPLTPSIKSFLNGGGL